MILRTGVRSPKRRVFLRSNWMIRKRSPLHLRSHINTAGLPTAPSDRKKIGLANGTVKAAYPLRRALPCALAEIRGSSVAFASARSAWTWLAAGRFSEPAIPLWRGGGL